MKKHQTGEVMLVMMVVMLAVVWFSPGLMGMMGHGAVHIEKSGDTAQQAKAVPPLTPVPKESPDHQH